MNKPEPPSPDMAPKSRPLPSYSAAELNLIADRCYDRRDQGFIVTPDSVQLFAEALRALARERANG